MPRLTSLSHGAGCACKLSTAELGEVLRHVRSTQDDRILVDASTRDDAAVFRLGPDRALISTTDFFTPIVDDPADWGRIAAANALSDVYAMGGTPLFALNLVAWPREGLPFELLGQVLAGAGEIADRARCPILGGHSIDDAEPKFGLAVTGEVHPDRMLTNAGARPGDLLVLTKPLGTGILTTALKRDVLDEAGLAQAVRSMSTLNDTACQAAVKHGSRAATDVTGFGLVGHLGSMMKASGGAAELWLDELPLLDHALELARKHVVPGGTRRNLQNATHVTWAADAPEEMRVLAADAQTSGGLLICIAEPHHEALVASLRDAGSLASATVGRVTTGEPGRIVTRMGGQAKGRV
ncbi:MAG TPA: selenide, water dikinase SelD [Gemmatimonadales bacterium]|nr:selenide, water dikinase SelD [Gemmatimonadales bacterium]